MSFLVVEVTSKGIIFGADRNVTSKYSDGSTKQNKTTEKVLLWPNGRCMVGYAGVGNMNGMSTRDWMMQFIQTNSNVGDLATLADQLKTEVESQRRIDEATRPANAFIIHLGGFELENGTSIPKIFLISNVRNDPGTGNYHSAQKLFSCTEEFWKYFPGTPIDQIRSTLEKREQDMDPFWFHQGFDLLIFNELHDNVRNAFKILMQGHLSHKKPTDLRGWERLVKMQILMHGAYFESFRETGEQYVGGGADICSIEWP